MYDLAIIGGGIVGLATAFEFLQINPYQKLILIEKEPQLVSHQTGNNGVRAQALAKNGKLLDDFKIIRNEKIVHVLNAPSYATASVFAIAENIISVFEA